MRNMFVATIASVCLCAAAFGAGGAEAPRHVFSMSCKVTAVNGELATAAGREKAIAWWRENGFTKLWLETYRHGEYVPTERLVEERDAFRAAGFAVCGMITPTMMNDPAPGAKEPQMVVCWSDPKARARMRDESARAARVFGTVIIDDFLFSSCGEWCAGCRADKERRGISDWGEYRRALMYEVCEKDILPAAKAANPAAHFIIKYPCWYRNYAKQGYDPVRQAKLFGECWVGTETRDANPEPIQACWIMAWMDELTGGRCGGGWYDALDCTPEKFVEQAYYTILGGARESLVHCYDYVLAADPGRTPFGEKAGNPGACRAAFERAGDELRRLADVVAGAERGPFSMGGNGVSTHVFLKDGKCYVVRLNTKGEPVAGLPPHGLELKEYRGE